MEDVSGGRTDSTQFQAFLADWEAILARRVDETLADFHTMHGLPDHVVRHGPGRQAIRDYGGDKRSVSGPSPTGDSIMNGRSGRSAQVPFGLERSQGDSHSPGMGSGRLEAFSDAVFAIAITLLALTLEVPELSVITPQALVAALADKWPVYLSFLLSFVTLLIAWVYHHRLLQGPHRADTRLLFANGILLLVVSSMPFPTALLGTFLTTPAAPVACVVYAGYNGLLNLTYNVLWWEVERPQRQTQGSRWRPPTSMVLSYLAFPVYVLATALAFWRLVMTLIICGTLWIVWTLKAPMLTPDR